jgi:hypothetical protein
VLSHTPTNTPMFGVLRNHRLQSSLACQREIEDLIVDQRVGELLEKPSILIHIPATFLL